VVPADAVLLACVDQVYILDHVCQVEGLLQALQYLKAVHGVLVMCRAMQRSYGPCV
jgi:hypothetical protein